MEGCEDVQFKQPAIIVFLTTENILPINIKSCMQTVYGDKCVDVSTVRQFKQEVGKQVLFLKTKEAWNEYGMKHAWDRCYTHKKLKCYLRSSVVYINKQNAFGVNIDGDKYGIFGTTLSELNSMKQQILKACEC